MSLCSFVDPKDRDIDFDLNVSTDHSLGSGASFDRLFSLLSFSFFRDISGIHYSEDVRSDDFLVFYVVSFCFIP